MTHKRTRISLSSGGYISLSDGSIKVVDSEGQAVSVEVTPDELIEVVEACEKLSEL